MIMIVVHMFANLYTYSTYVCIFIDVKISNKNTLFQYVISQIPFTGYPFAILGIKRLDCTHGVDRNSSKKKKYLENKMEKVTFVF